MTSIFISYARDDDEPFAKDIYRDPSARGFGVWWDRTVMESRGFTFLQEIREAISEADRLILVVGPKAVQSDYVRAEWEFALEGCKYAAICEECGSFRRSSPDDSCSGLTASRKLYQYTHTI